MGQAKRIVICGAARRVGLASFAPARLRPLDRMRLRLA